MPCVTSSAARAVAAAAALFAVSAKVVTIRNDIPRLDVNGQYIDAHDGCIVAHGGTYFLYGESYGNATGGTFPGDWGNSPQLAVYTSPDLTTWTYRGSPLSSDTADATKWIPNVLWVEAKQHFIMWGGSGDWFVATSTDGIAFTLVTPHTTSRLGGGTDGTVSLSTGVRHPPPPPRSFIVRSILTRAKNSPRHGPLLRRDSLSMTTGRATLPFRGRARASTT